MKNIIKSQIVQDDIGEVKIRIVKNSSYGDKDSEVLLEGLRKCLGREIEIMFEFVDNIERTKSGKYRWVVSSAHKKRKSLISQLSEMQSLS